MEKSYLIGYYWLLLQKPGIRKEIRYSYFENVKLKKADLRDVKGGKVAVDSCDTGKAQYLDQGECCDTCTVYDDGSVETKFEKC